MNHDTRAEAYGSAAPDDRLMESPYAQYSHGALIDQYYESEGRDYAIGEELGIRLFEHAGLAGDPRSMPLVGRGGPQFAENGRPLMLSDYVNFAAQRHIEALEEILDFLKMEPGTTDYENVRSVMLGRLNAGRG